MSKNNYTEKYITFQGNKVYVKVSGVGQPLLLIHGLGTDHSMWGMNITALNKKFKVIAIDLPGFGKSDKPDVDYSIGFFTEAVKSIITSEGLKKVHLLGASLGGRIVLDVAIKYPELVEKLIVVSPAGISKLAKGIFGSSLGGELVAFAFSKRMFIEKILSQMVYDQEGITTSLVDTFIEGAKDKRYQRAFKRAGYGLGEEIDSLLEGIPKIKLDTLIIWGENDKVVPVKDGHFLHKQIANSKLVIFSQCGNLPFMEKTVPFNKVIIDFLTDCI